MKIVIENQGDGQIIEFQREFVQFSEFVNSDTQEGENYRIPLDATIHSRCIQLIKEFVEIHNYCVTSVRFDRCFDKSQMKKGLSNETANFVDRIEEMQDLEVQQLLRTAQFLQVEPLSRVIYSFLALKYGASLIDRQKKKRMEELKVPNYDIEEVKIQYEDFFRSYGSSLLSQFHQ